MGMGESMEEYKYGVIKNIRPEKGTVSVSVVFYLSSTDRSSW